MLVLSMFLAFVVLTLFLLAFILFTNEDAHNSLVRTIYGCNKVYLLIKSYDNRCLFELSRDKKVALIPFAKVSFNHHSVKDTVKDVLSRLIPLRCNIDYFPHKVERDEDGNQYYITDPKSQFEPAIPYTWSFVYKRSDNKLYVKMDNEEGRKLPLILDSQNLRILEQSNLVITT